ncbi:uncharacterized protein RHIMIDRAFT_254377 [Rhizopus microsporus ATCC 52813]|uniref:Tc1-like transposase DDE domain-containing protein n=1 Tax=Rhizopus microsporus ATCC 52813 TaxID=1340429 RepID=A0A2G4T9B8_RHIZD|nr:uncharacterized protein RHIMIDRAFT_254377 [Rhizopus microsporus ATCC 52813]PHZ17607.1 hypothetical protein RHIMIDRAFT_254377 [Rhizopus microsporus ATCC 52813]
MDVLDKLNKHDLYIVVDYYRIHHYQYVVDAAESRDYKLLFMPPYCRSNRVSRKIVFKFSPSSLIKRHL